MKILSLDSVGFSYPQNPLFTNLTLDVFQGDFIGIFGENGKGKTTLIELMLGLKPIDSGSIVWYAPDGTPSKQSCYNIEYISQKANSIDSMIPITVSELLKVGNKSRVSLFEHTSKSCSYESIDASLKHVGIQHLRDAPFSKLSQGQKQRVFIAKALIANPDLIIMDEPTSGVDLMALKHFYDLLAHLNQAHKITILIVSHDSRMSTNQINRVWYVGKKHCDECHHDAVHQHQIARMFGHTELQFIG